MFAKKCHKPNLSHTKWPQILQQIFYLDEKAPISADENLFHPLTPRPSLDDPCSGGLLSLADSQLSEALTPPSLLSPLPAPCILPAVLRDRPGGRKGAPPPVPPRSPRRPGHSLSRGGGVLAGPVATSRMTP